jgi:hypothetical protein
MDADCSALIAAGWGGHERWKIPKDWESKRGPDEIPGVRAPDVRKYFGKRKLAMEASLRHLEAEIDAAIRTPQPDALPKRTDRNGHRLPLDRWQHRRALYLARKFGA